MFNNAINSRKGKQTYLKQFKDVYKMSGAVQRLIRSKAKLVARYTKIMLQILKFTIITNRLEIKATFVIKSSPSLCEANLACPCISSIKIIVMKLSYNNKNKVSKLCHLYIPSECCHIFLLLDLILCILVE